ncbi:MAG: DUF2442 domain-containing protein [Pseudobdellovibrionaceae bacterium]
MITGGDLIEVESVFVENNFELNVRFTNGQQKKVDLSPLLKNPPPVFAKLRDKSEFNKVSINPVGGIQWECGADLSAEYLLGA